jgi:ATP-dependent helicase STH1/SNF2
LHQVLRPFLLRRIKADVETELPPKSETVVKVELSAWQRIVYNGIKKKGKLALDPASGKTGSTGLNNTLMQMRKICLHPYLFLDSYFNNTEDILRCSGKFELLDRLIPKLIKTGHKTLIFSQFVMVLEIMAEFFLYRGIHVLKLTGDQKIEERDINLKKFEESDSKEKVFLLSTRAGGTGLNLQVADTVIIFDTDYNPQMDEQAKDRVHRIGQKNEVKVLRLISNATIEEGILLKAMGKKQLDNKIIQAGTFNEKANE